MSSDELEKVARKVRDSLEVPKPGWPGGEERLIQSCRGVEKKPEQLRQV